MHTCTPYPASRPCRASNKGCFLCLTACATAIHHAGTMPASWPTRLCMHGCLYRRGCLCPALLHLLYLLRSRVMRLPPHARPAGPRAWRRPTSITAPGRARPWTWPARCWRCRSTLRCCTGSAGRARRVRDYGRAPHRARHACTRVVVVTIVTYASSLHVCNCCKARCIFTYCRD